MINNRIWVLLGKKANSEATTEELAELELLMRNDNFFDKNYHLLNKVAELKIQSKPEGC